MPGFRLHTRELAIVIDDTDPSIVYHGAWSTQSPSNGQYNNTVTGTTIIGDSASYTFKGTLTPFVAFTVTAVCIDTGPCRDSHTSIRPATPKWH